MVKYPLLLQHRVSTDSDAGNTNGSKDDLGLSKLVLGHNVHNVVYMGKYTVVDAYTYTFYTASSF